MAGDVKRLMTINLGDERRLLTMKTILSYESAVRGLTIGQTLQALLLEAADVDGYPPEVRERLAEIHAEQRARATRRCLAQDKAS